MFVLFHLNLQIQLYNRQDVIDLSRLESLLL